MKERPGDKKIPLDSLLKERRSVRRYQSRPLPAEMIQTILAAGIWAPSPSNSQPVRFVGIESNEIKTGLELALNQGYAHLLAQNEAEGGSKHTRNWIRAYYRYSQFMFTAPALFAMGVKTGTLGFADRMVAANVLPSNERQETDLDISVGLALKGVLLKAHELGVGTCILTAPLVFIDDCTAILGLDDFKIKCFLTAGFAKEAPPPTSRLSLEEIYKIL